MFYLYHVSESYPFLCLHDRPSGKENLNVELIAPGKRRSWELFFEHAHVVNTEDTETIIRSSRDVVVLKDSAQFFNERTNEILTEVREYHLVKTIK